MPPNEDVQAEDVDDTSQAMVRLSLSQTPSSSSPPSSLLSPARTQQTPPPAPAQGSLTLSTANFLGLPREIRNMIYTLILAVDPNPPLIEDDETPYVLPHTDVLCVNCQVRREATEILRSSNTWVVLVAAPIRLHRLISCSQALLQTPGLDQRLFVQRRSIVIEVGLGCGFRNSRPLQGAQHTVTYVFAYNRQGFAYLCLRLRQNFGLYGDMTVILNMPRTLGNAAVVQNVVFGLSQIRGLQNAACIGFPQPQQAQQLEQRMTTNYRSWGEIYHHLKELSDQAKTAVNAGQREEAIHRYRIACITSNTIFYMPHGSLSVSVPHQNASVRINAQFAYKKCAAILDFVSTCQHESIERFASLSNHLIEDAVREANMALLGDPGNAIVFRDRAYGLRGTALRRRAEYRRLKEVEASMIRSDLENAALDFYFAFILVGERDYPRSLELDRWLTEVEIELGTSRADTIARAETESAVGPWTGLRHHFDVRLLREWQMSARLLMNRLPGWNVFPPPAETMGLI